MFFYYWHFTSTFTVELLIVKVYIISALYRYTAKWRHKLQPPPPLFTAWKEPLISAFSSATGAEGSHRDHCKYLADKRFTDRLQRFGKLEPWWIRSLIPPPPSYSFSKREQLICAMISTTQYALLFDFHPWILKSIIYLFYSDAYCI